MNNTIEKIVSQTKLSTQEAWWLIEWATEKSKVSLLATDHKLTTEEQEKIDDAVEKIADKSMPLAYIIGHVPFGSLTIKVQPPILIPRQETEEWVHKLIETLQPHKEKINSILDIGTGTGCIALTLAHAFPNAHVTASDINPKALELAQQNAEKNSIKNISFIESDLFKNISGTFDLIVSNPPYIAPHYEKTLDQSVLNWEDKQALFAQENGLQLIYKIIQELPNKLNKSNLPVQAVFECDPEQTTNIITYAQKYGFKGTAHTDSFNNQRSVFLSR